MLSLILFIAGIVHLIKPEIFLPAMPPLFPYPLQIIIATGVIEILFAIGILISKLKRVSGYLLILYFIAILPAHIHVAINEVPMFGVTSSFLLWGRTLFQIVFIIWTYRVTLKS